MRLLVISSYWPRPGRIHNAVFEVEQVAAWVKLGHQVDVLVQTVFWRPNLKFVGPPEMGPDSARVSVRQIVVPRLPELMSKGQIGTLANIVGTGLRIRAWMKLYECVHGEADAIIVHGERNVGLSAGIWNHNRLRPAAMIVHGADPVLERLPAPFLRRRCGARANAGLARVILVGNRLRTYANRVGYDERRVTVIPNGFQPPVTARIVGACAQRPLRLSVVARLVKVKGIDDTLLALSRIASARPNLDWRFDILGDGPERESLEALSNQLGLGPRVHFHGAATHDEVIRCLEQTEIFVMPSWNEAFGLAYLEAMAVGAVVVGCRENGAEDIVQDGVDGCLVPPRDVDALRGVLEMLIDEPSLRLTLAQAARESVKRFSWSTNARAVLESLHNGSQKI